MKTAQILIFLSSKINQRLSINIEEGSTVGVVLQGAYFVIQILERKKSETKFHQKIAAFWPYNVDGRDDDTRMTTTLA